MISRARFLLFFGVAGMVAAVFGIPLASAADSQTSVADVAPYAVEDYNYPNAATIETEQGIKLKRGDGHLTLVKCDFAADQITVMTVLDPSVPRGEVFCFKATTKTAFLTLELPRVFALEAGTHPYTADLTANGETKSVAIAKGGYQSVGEGIPGGARSVLVEIRVTG